MVTVLESITTLHPRLDQNHYQTAYELLRKEMGNHPEYDGLIWECRVEQNLSDGTALVRITVSDRRIISPVMWFFILSLIALAWIYFGG